MSRACGGSGTLGLIGLVVAGAVLVAAGRASQAQGEGEDGSPRRAGRVVEEVPQTWTVEMGGTVDGTMTRTPVGYSWWRQGPQPMEYVRMENVGERPVANPWLVVKGKRNWRRIEDVVAEVVRPEMSEREKALRLWWFQVNHRFHAFTDDNENNDEIKVLNVYGYTLCGNDAEVLGHLFQAAGLRVRPGHPTGHCTTEVFWDGRWHLLDGDENIIALLRDNHTIASEEDIVRDHDLMKRTHTYGILSNDDRFRDEFSASLCTYEGERKEGRGFHTRHTMDFMLLPGEALVWRWQSRGKYHGVADLPGGWGQGALDRVANGEMIYRPDLRAAYVAEAVAAREGCVVGEEDPGKPAIHLLPEASEGHVDFALRSPYPLVGGDFRASAAGEGKVKASLVLGEQEHVIAEGPVTGTGGISGDLDRFLPRDGAARHEATLRLWLSGKAGVESFSLRFDLQMAPLSLPELELGQNEVRYVDDSGERRVRVTFAWRELDYTRPPKAPATAVFPEDGGQAQGTKLGLRWAEAVDPDGDEIADYWLELSEREDMAWPLSPNFRKLISNTADAGKAQYTLPYEGLLAPDTTYYWRVRARDARGVWGPWSRPWRFSCRAPAPPEELEAVADQARGEVRIRWRAAEAGTRPVKYRVYGSDEQGFTVSEEPYEVMWTNLRSPNRKEMPASLLGETDGREMLVVGPGLEASAANRAFYRVVAVDADGVRSGPSDYVALPRPFIYSSPGVVAVAGREHRYEARSLYSLGDLRCHSITKPDGTLSCYNADFWDVEKVRWSRAAGPDWLSVDAETGLVSGVPPAGFDGAEVVITAEIEGRGKAEQRFRIARQD